MVSQRTWVLGFVLNLFKRFSLVLILTIWPYVLTQVSMIASECLEELSPTIEVQSRQVIIKLGMTEFNLLDLGEDSLDTVESKTVISAVPTAVKLSTADRGLLSLIEEYRREAQVRLCGEDHC